MKKIILVVLAIALAFATLTLQSCAASKGGRGDMLPRSC